MKEEAAWAAFGLDGNLGGEAADWSVPSSSWSQMSSRGGGALGFLGILKLTEDCGLGES